VASRFVFSMQVSGGEVQSISFSGASAQVGRLSTADLRVPDATVSRLHCVLKASADNALTVEDLGGAGGIGVNGSAVKEHLLIPGDVLQLGNSRLTYERCEVADETQQIEVPVQTSSKAEPRAAQKEQLEEPPKSKQKKRRVIPQTEVVLVEPESPPTPDDALLEVSVWGSGERIEQFNFRPMSVHVGQELPIPVEGASFAGRMVFHHGDQGWSVLVPPGATWKPLHGGGKLTRPELVPGFFREGDAVGAPIGMRDSGSFTLGAVQLDYRLVAPAKVIPSGPLGNLDFDFMNLLLVSFLIHAALIIVLALQPPSVTSLEDTLSRAPNRFVRLMLKKRKKPPEIEKKKQVVKAKAKKTEAEKAASPEDERPDEAKKAPTEAERAAAAAAAESLFGGANSGMASEALGAGASQMEQALGSISSEDPNASLVGLTDSAVVRRAQDKFKVKVATRGRAAGNLEFGRQQADLGKKTKRSIQLNSGKSKIKGALAREVVERVVRSHRSQIKYCYEKELMRTPGLEGKIGIQWVIGGNGRVTRVSVKEDGTTLKNKAMHRCLSNKIRTWAFPKPKGGGVVIVNWPFLFKEAG
jgi:pSer/pThr/pTyr-binding forkhead associated (FHA) protein